MVFASVKLAFPVFPLRCVSILLDADPNVINWSDYEGRTALHLAVADSASDDAAVVKALLRDRRVQVIGIDSSNQQR